MTRRNAKKISHNLCGNCLLKHDTAGKIEGRMEVRRKRGTRRKQLLDYFKEMTRYWKLKRGSTRSQCGGIGYRSGCGPDIRLTIEWINGRIFSKSD